MPQTVNEVMTADPRTVAPGDSLIDAARHRRDGDVGAVVVEQEGRATGIVTDRDMALDDESALADISAASPNR
jgi:CBS domain-containing protein